MNSGKLALKLPTETRPAPTTLNILGVEYWRVQTGDQGDLYLTRFGAPFLHLLLPENWFTSEWFEKNRVKLEGSSTVYRVRTKPIAGRSLEIVVKWCRVGEQVPFDTMTLNKFAQAEFNSPYEEFALVTEMRDRQSPAIISTHKPLGIYVPAERLHLWQTGRSASKMAQKKAKHRDVELDIYRQYILIYEWIKGAAIAEIIDQTDIPPAARPAALEAITLKATADLAGRGFRVLDMKPAHIIVRTTPDGKLIRRRSGEVAYALVDFELLQRTPEHEQAVTRARRTNYLQKQRDRFGQTADSPMPAHLRLVRIFGVDYVFGPTESTRGALWVAGHVPGLFDYFLPERWRRTPRTNLSKTGEVYFTKTKDKINIVWRVSKIGERPEVETTTPQGQRIVKHGYNSPFEEFALALELNRKGVPTVYPRAIYMTGLEAESAVYLEDSSRYTIHARLLTPTGEPILRPNHNYITIWGFWNGQDELLAASDQPTCEGVNLFLAAHAGYVPKEEHQRLLEVTRQKLAAAGMEDLNYKNDHLLLSLSPQGVLLRNADSLPEVRLCNFELMARPDAPSADG